MVSINFFRNAKNQQQLDAGETLFREGDSGEAMYAVIEGQLELSCGGHVLDEVGPGGIVGEMALIDHSPRSATVTAKTATTVAAIDERQFMFMVQEHPTFAILVMTVMAERLRRSDATIVGESN